MERDYDEAEGDLSPMEKVVWIPLLIWFIIMTFVCGACTK